MSGRNEYSVKNRYYYLMKTHKLDSVTVSDEELRRLAEKKQAAIEGKRQKGLLLAPSHEPLAAGANPNAAQASMAFQSFMMNYQSFMQFQSMWYFRRNMENFFSNMQNMQKFTTMTGKSLFFCVFFS